MFPAGSGRMGTVWGWEDMLFFGHWLLGGDVGEEEAGSWTLPFPLALLIEGELHLGGWVSLEKVHGTEPTAFLPCTQDQVAGSNYGSLSPRRGLNSVQVGS